MDQDDGRPNAMASNATRDVAPGNVTLRIVILAHGSGREDDLYLVLSLDTTLDELKNRIQESLPQRPSPSQQRIIYQGRGLDNPSDTLRSILRQDSRAGNSSYVLHLVIRQLPTDSQSAASAPSTTSQTTINSNAPQPGSVHIHNSQTQTPQEIPHTDHARTHNQLHLLQHSMLHQQAIQRAQLQAQAQVAAQAQAQAQARIQQEQSRLSRTVGRPAGQRPTPAVILPDFNPAQPITGSRDGQVNITQNDDDSHQPAADQSSQIPQTLPTTSTSSTNVLHPQIPQAFAPQMLPGASNSPNVSTTQMRTTIDSNGQQTRTIVNGGPTGSTTVTFRVTGLNPPNPLDRPSSAPGASPSADADPANRIINPVPGNIQLQPPMPPMPAGFPFPPGLQLPFPMPNMLPLMNNPFQQAAQQSLTPQPTAWLLSSPNGPQGIVFAPGHGFFSTVPSITAQASQLQPTRTVAVSATPTTSTPAQQAQLVVRTQAGSTTPAAPQPGARPAAPTGGLPVAAQPRPAARARARPNLDQNEILQFILGRGWLFLRLYMFVFVFSESGTWRRILMIAAIVIYCSLPRQNPLTNGFQIVRRHFDNLIGPPNIPQRTPQAQQNEQNDGRPAAAQPTQTQTGPSTSTGHRSSAMPTPEETARRLLDQQNRRNPNAFIDMLYRIEQGLVLFLASLVPGVGERHVRAREEARRIIQEEEQRRIAEGQQQGQATGEGVPGQSGTSDLQADVQRHEDENGPLPDGWKTATQLHEEARGQQGSSSGVDRTGTSGNEGIRSRTTNTGD